MYYEYYGLWSHQFFNYFFVMSSSFKIRWSLIHKYFCLWLLFLYVWKHCLCPSSEYICSPICSSRNCIVFTFIFWWISMFSSTNLFKRIFPIYLVCHFCILRAHSTTDCTLSWGLAVPMLRKRVKHELPLLGERCELGLDCNPHGWGAVRAWAAAIEAEAQVRHRTVPPQLKCEEGTACCNWV